MDSQLRRAIDIALERFGNKDEFQRRSDEGFDEVAYYAKLVSGSIAMTWVFFKREGVVTYRATRVKGAAPMLELEKSYTSREFETYLRSKNVSMSGRARLSEVLDAWGELPRSA